MGACPGPPFTHLNAGPIQGGQVRCDRHARTGQPWLNTVHPSAQHATPRSQETTDQTAAVSKPLRPGIKARSGEEERDANELPVQSEHARATARAPFRGSGIWNNVTAQRADSRRPDRDSVTSRRWSSRSNRRRCAGASIRRHMNARIEPATGTLPCFGRVRARAPGAHGRQRDPRRF